MKKEPNPICSTRFISGGFIKLFLFLLIIPGFVMTTSCSSTACDEDTETNLVMTLFKSGGSNKVVTDSISLFGIQMPDSLLYDNYSADHLRLQLDPSSSISSYVIVKGSAADTVGIEYASSFRFISKSCGYTYDYKISSINFTRNWIDTILVINSDIEIPENENLRTFY